MATYNYKARDKYGKLAEGTMIAESDKAVALKLTQMGYLPVHIAESKEKIVSARSLNKLRRIKFSDLTMFTRQLYTLQKAGLPILSSLIALREQVPDKFFKDVIAQITRDVEAGTNLSSAMGRHPQIFNSLYVNMIQAGETSGRLPETLERLAVLGEHEEKMRLRIQGAMRYPLIVVCAIVLGFLTIVTYVVPKFVTLYSQHTAVLPRPTQILIGINSAITHYWWLMIILAAVIVFVLRQSFSTQKGLLWLDAMKLKMPIFGPLLENIIMSRFCRITGTLMRSGVPILQILDLIADGIGNSVIAKTIATIKADVNEGKGMSEPMKASGMFPPIVVQMVAVGESTGKTEELLIHVADYYDSQVDYTINNLVTLIEPLLIFVLGIVILFIALGVYMPMWNMINVFKH